MYLFLVNGGSSVPGGGPLSNGVMNGSHSGHNDDGLQYSTNGSDNDHNALGEQCSNNSVKSDEGVEEDEKSESKTESSDMNGGAPTLRKRSSKLSLRPNLKAINEDRELSVERHEYQDVFHKKAETPDSDVDFSPVDKPPLGNRWSNLSTDSVDFNEDEDEAESLAYASRDPDVMAADHSRGSPQSKRNRRSGFAFNIGDNKIPSNAFCNTKTQDPKMLTVTEMMMKLHMPHAKELDMHRKLSQPDIVLPKVDLAIETPERRLSEVSEKQLSKQPSVDATCTTSLFSAAFNKTKFSLLGMRETHSEEVKNELDFLDCPTDPRLNLSPMHRAMLLRFNPVVRFLLGLLFGLVLGLVIRYKWNQSV